MFRKWFEQKENIFKNEWKGSYCPCEKYTFSISGPPKKLWNSLNLGGPIAPGVEFDKSKPDGTPRKLMDVSKMKEIGWQYSTELEDGIKKTYNWFLENIDKIKEIKL